MKSRVSNARSSCTAAAEAEAEAAGLGLGLELELGSADYGDMSAIPCCV